MARCKSLLILLLEKICHDQMPVGGRRHKRLLAVWEIAPMKSAPFISTDECDTFNKQGLVSKGAFAELNSSITNAN